MLVYLLKQNLNFKWLRFSVDLNNVLILLNSEETFWDIPKYSDLIMMTIDRFIKGYAFKNIYWPYKESIVFKSKHNIFFYLLEDQDSFNITRYPVRIKHLWCIKNKFDTSFILWHSVLPTFHRSTLARKLLRSKSLRFEYININKYKFTIIL